MQLYKGQTRAKPHGSALLQPDEPRTRIYRKHRSACSRFELKRFPLKIVVSRKSMDCLLVTDVSLTQF